MSSTNENRPYLTISELTPGALIALQIATVLLVGSYLCSSIFTSDFYWHLSLGHWLKQRGAIPSANFWTFVGEDLTWANGNWLFQWSLATVELWFGEHGLLYYKVLTFVALVAVLARVYTLWASDNFLAYLMTILVSCGLLTNAAFSPTIWGWIFFAAFCDFLFRARYGATEGTFFVVVSVLGAIGTNVHPIFLWCALLAPLGLLLPAPGDAKLVKDVVLLFFILCLVQFVTPYGTGQIENQLAGLRYYCEAALLGNLQPATIYDFPTAFLVLTISILGALWYATPRSLHIREAFAVTIAVLSGLLTKTATPYALIFCGFMICTMWSRSYDGKRGNFGSAVELMRLKLSGLPALGVIFVLLCGVFANCAKLYAQPSVTAFFPAREMDYVIEHDLPAPLYHPVDVGGYMVYRIAAIPNSRQVAMLAPAVEHLVPRLSRLAKQVDALAPGWQEFWSSIVSPFTAVVRYDSAIYSYLLQHADWRLVFQNSDVWPPPEESKRLQAGKFSWAVFVRD